jgi:hypothetical protein
VLLALARPFLMSELSHRACTVSIVIVSKMCAPCLQDVIFTDMDDELVKKLRSEFARQGGLARAKALTAKQRKESAIKASKAAAQVRTQKAKARKARAR